MQFNWIDETGFSCDAVEVGEDTLCNVWEVALLNPFDDSIVLNPEIRAYRNEFQLSSRVLDLQIDSSASLSENQMQCSGSTEIPLPACCDTTILVTSVVIAPMFFHHPTATYDTDLESSGEIC